MTLEIDKNLVYGGLIESGSNVNGKWYKYQDGTMVCTNKKIINTTLSTAYGSFYITPALEMNNFPVEFIATPIVTSSLESSSNTFVLSGGNFSNKTKIGSIYLMGTFNIGNIVCEWNYIAVGKWK